jgi:hypothetical protein
LHRDRLNKLAEIIDTLAEKDAEILRRTRDMVALRRSAASELHGICAAFVSSLNELLSKTRVEMVPPEYGDESFHEHGVNLLQIDIRGRILQVEFRATPELVSTEEFRVPYILEGSVRSFNQQLLEQNLIREHWLFYCLHKHGNMWRYFDERTYHSGAFDQQYLTTLLEELL